MDNSCPITTWIPDANPTTSWVVDDCLGQLTTAIVQAPPPIIMDDLKVLMDDLTATMDNS